MEEKTKTRSGGPGAASLGAATVLAERPAGVPKADTAKRLHDIILRIERANRNSLFRDELPKFMENLCAMMGDMEALLLSSTPKSEEGKVARCGLEIIRDHGAPELKAQAARILGEKLPETSWELLSPD